MKFLLLFLLLISCNSNPITLEKYDVNIIITMNNSTHHICSYNFHFYIRASERSEVREMAKNRFISYLQEDGPVLICEEDNKNILLPKINISSFTME